MNRIAWVSLAVIGMLSLAVAAVADEGWLVDFKAAKEKSKTDGKDVLMEFTGSDWCPPCIALKKTVLDSEIFKREAPENFILLKLDSPNDKSKQAPDEIEQYKKLSAEYQVRGVPTIILADGEGRPYARNVGYGGTKPEDWMKDMIEKKAIREKRDAALAKAEKAKGVEKAKLLDEALATIDAELAGAFYTSEIDEIIKLDAKDEAGLKTKYEAGRKLAQFKTRLQEVRTSGRGDLAGTVKKVDDLISELSPEGEALQEALFYKANLLFVTKEKAKAKEALEQALKVAPDSRTARQIQSILDTVFKEEEKPEPKTDEPKKEPAAEKK